MIDVCSPWAYHVELLFYAVSGEGYNLPEFPSVLFLPSAHVKVLVRPARVAFLSSSIAGEFHIIEYGDYCTLHE